MTLIGELKKNRASFMEKLKNEVIKNSTNGGVGNQADERFWQPTKDKVGNAVSIVRFLPNVKVEDLPWSRVYSHGFQNKNNGAWYIEECPTTIGQKCPVCESNAVLWNTGIEKNKNIVRERKRKLHYISNILVISDPGAPENEGMVKLFKYGKKIFDKINSAMFPEFEDIKPLNPFDPWEGANFKLRVRKFEGYTNYDKSEFSDVSALSDDDSGIEDVINRSFSLNEFVDPKNFKNYDELKARLSKVLSEDVTSTAEVCDDDDEDGDINIVVREEKSYNTINRTKVDVIPNNNSSDEDDIQSYLKSLAEDTD